MYTICLLSSVFCLLFTGCTSFPTVDVKGSPSADGPYIGFRQQASQYEGKGIYRNYVDLGSGWIQGDSVYAPDGSFFHVDTSLPLYDEDLVRFGIATGKNLFFGGINLFGRGETRYEEFYLSANYKANFTLSKYWGDTDQVVRFDLTAEYPPHMGGLRLNWHEGGREFSFLAGTRWIPAEMENFEFEFGIDFGWDYIYSREAHTPNIQAGICMRYFFKPERPDWPLRK